MVKCIVEVVNGEKVGEFQFDVLPRVGEHMAVDGSVSRTSSTS